MNKTPNTSRESVPQIPMERCEILREALANADNALKICYADSHLIRTKWLREKGHDGIADVIDNIRKWSGFGHNERRLALSSVPLPTEALTASGVSAQPEDQKCDHKCVICHPSPSPLVSVEEWMERDVHNLAVNGPLSHPAYWDRNIANAHNASLASLTAETDKQRLQIKALQCIEVAYNAAHHLLSELGVNEQGLSVYDRIDKLASRLEEAEKDLAETVKEFNRGWLILCGARTDYPVPPVTLGEHAEAIINERNSLRTSLAVAEADRERLHAFIVDQCTDSYCEVHGFVEDSHRCNSFDNMGYQVRLRPEAKELIAMTSKEASKKKEP